MQETASGRPTSRTRSPAWGAWRASACWSSSLTPTRSRPR